MEAPQLKLVEGPTDLLHHTPSGQCEHQPGDGAGEANLSGQDLMSHLSAQICDALAPMFHTILELGKAL